MSHGWWYSERVHFWKVFFFFLRGELRGRLMDTGREEQDYNIYIYLYIYMLDFSLIGV